MKFKKNKYSPLLIMINYQSPMIPLELQILYVNARPKEMLNKNNNLLTRNEVPLYFTEKN